MAVEMVAAEALLIDQTGRSLLNSSPRTAAALQLHPERREGGQDACCRTGLTCRIHGHRLPTHQWADEDGGPESGCDDCIAAHLLLSEAHPKRGRLLPFPTLSADDAVQHVPRHCSTETYTCTISTLCCQPAKRRAYASKDRGLR